MIKWVVRYEEARNTRSEERLAFKRHSRHLPYLQDLEPLPKDCNIEWLHEAMDQVENEGEVITNEE